MHRVWEINLHYMINETWSCCTFEYLVWVLILKTLFYLSDFSFNYSAIGSGLVVHDCPSYVQFIHDCNFTSVDSCTLLVANCTETCKLLFIYFIFSVLFSSLAIRLVHKVEINMCKLFSFYKLTFNLTQGCSFSLVICDIVTIVALCQRFCSI